ncbi:MULTISPECIES: DUF4239 domain-containing protein [unclassified Rhizobium]|uniref:bestrophin-like domain n=1 Tax=unclassified Rhizobium TaxID=2613769 RepID=UPI001620B363|nr:MULTISPECIES: DUF4239 domain-containing protein [unclassified Rhizobium]MBB3319703.1 type II secretory pathway pseudopilin PulG [Rhizobium sp. BK181]MBB3544821.1 type II secretory pathway pseudopilin PulG [Rhizobium sp. BK399]MCS4095510.1 type II secretory pathway pseudopilin PulG [Rhizobium sp. BK176]
MTALSTGCIIALLLASGALVGALISRRLPNHHLSTESKEAIKLATAIVGTLAALALGFLVASAKTTFDDAETELRESAARLVLLDRVLAQYGPGLVEVRKQLSALVSARIERSFEGGKRTAIASSPEDDPGIEPVQRALRALTPDDEVKRLLKNRALDISGAIAESHWLVLETGEDGLPGAFLVVLTFWLIVIFFTFGLLSPFNGTVISIVVVCAISVGGAIFIVNDMAHPYGGLISVSDESLRIALSRMGRN